MTPTGPRLELSLPALPTSARRARVAVAAAVAELGIDQRVVDDIRLCVSEAVTNAVRHAYGSDAGTVEITVVDRDQGVVVVVRDFGSGVMGLPRNGAGGFGLAIIDALSDDCALSSVSGAGTEVSMAFGTTLAGRRRAVLSIRRRRQQARARGRPSGLGSKCLARVGSGWIGVDVSRLC